MPAPPTDLMNATVQVPAAFILESGYCYVKPDDRPESSRLAVHEFWKYGSEPADGMRCRVQFDHATDEAYLVATLDPNRNLLRRS